MDLKQLEYFEKVAELQHFTKAANQIHISQAALSQSMKALESELNQTFFVKSGRNVVLTEAGKLYYDYVHRALNILRAGDIALKDYSHNENRIIRIISPTLFGFKGLFSLLEKASGGANICSIETNFDDMVKALVSGTVDICISQRYVFTPDVHCLHLRSVHLGLLVPENHKFANRKSISLREIEHEELASFCKGIAQRMNFDEICERKGFSPKISLELNNYADLVRAVETEMFCAPVPPTILKNYKSSRTKFVPFNDIDDMVSHWLCWAKINPLKKPIVKEIIHTCLEYFADDANFSDD